MPSHDERMPPEISRHIQEILERIPRLNVESTVASHLVVVALHVMWCTDSETKGPSTIATEDGSEDDLDEAFTRIAKDSLDVVRSCGRVLRWDEWIHLLRQVSLRMVLLPTTHPAHSYASYQIPYLTDTQLQEAQHILNVKESGSVLCMMRDVQERSPPRLFAALLDKNDEDGSPGSLDHSCVPKAMLSLRKNSVREGEGMLDMTALYDVAGSETGMAVDRLQCRDDTLEDRVRKFRNALYPACTCDRCQYEISPSCLPRLCTEKILLLAHFYMAMNDLDQASRLYEEVRRRDAAHPDAWHALGAIELSKGCFLAGQRIWQAAQRKARRSPHHAGLELQWTKLERYGYLAASTGEQIPRRLPESTEIYSNTFVTKVLEPETCDRLYEWACAGKWTQKRHYAVPTVDVPVHEIAPLLDWFKNFMADTVRPLLALQFKKSKNFFVHDAFVVRYTSGAQSNHLPIHTDESTHSLVIALNDAFRGGGTYFHDSDKVVDLWQGEMLSFRGDSLLHGGESLRDGTRLIMADFLYHDDDRNKKMTPTAHKRPSRTPGDIESPRKQARSTFAFDFQLPLTK